MAKTNQSKTDVIQVTQQGSSSLSDWFGVLDKLGEEEVKLQEEFLKSLEKSFDRQDVEAHKIWDLANTLYEESNKEANIENASPLRENRKAFYRNAKQAISMLTTCRWVKKTLKEHGWEIGHLHSNIERANRKIGGRN